MSGTELAATLRRLRSSAELTQEQLADRAGISVRAVSDIERGARRRIYPVTARQLASALDLPPAERTAFERVARGVSPVTPPNGATGTGTSGTSGTATGTDGSESTGAGGTGTAVTGGAIGVLPVPRTSLFGRQQEIGELSALLACEPPALITVTGPGGVGKTRLVLETARACSSGFAAVHWVELGQLDDPALVVTTIARSVGAAASPLTGPDPVTGLAGVLAVRRTLLILDTFEHLLAAGPDVAELLSRCPGLTVLVTSRARLRLNGEREFALGPIGVPADSVELFVDRALAANRQLTVDPVLATDICRRLEGIPLAIELAAARTRHLALPDLARQLEQGSGVLSRGPQDLPQRQESMQATVAWSYHLLDAGARTLARRLAVFADWTLEQVQAVCMDGLDADPLETLSTLLDHSLVTVSPPGTCATRYRMLDVVREYVAREAVVPDDTTVLRSRHAEYFLGLVHDLEPLLRATGQSTAHLRLDVELPNLRSAHRWLLGNDPRRAMAMAGSLWMFWLWRGGVPEGRRWLVDALAVGGSEDIAARAKALWGAGWLAFHQGDVRETSRYGDELLGLARESGSAIQLRNALTLAGMTSMAAADFEAARSSFEAARDALRETVERWLIATSALNLGLAELHSGEVAAAERHFVEAAQQYAELGDQTYLDRANRHVAAAALVNGQLERAEQLFAAELVRDETRTDWGVAESLEGLSWVAAVRGDAERAGELARDAATIRERLGVQLHPFDVLLSRRFRGQD